MRLSNQIVLATENREKFEEFRALFSVHPEIELFMASYFLRNTAGIGFAERHETYLENAEAKARLVNQGCHYPSLADDSGLEVEGLGWKPGVRSHRYASPKPGLTQDAANVELMLRELSGKSRSARFVCTLAFVQEGTLIHATGTLEGTIAEAPRGQLGFGYDPIFIPSSQNGANRTLAEMTATEKNQLSHRAKALQELWTKIQAEGLIFAKP